MSIRPVRSILLGALGVLLLMVLTACGSEPPTGTATGPGETSTSTSEPTPAGSAPPGTTAPADGTDAVDEPFCVALSRYLELDSDASSPTPTGSLTADERATFVDVVIPALEDLQAATPTELREPIDYLLQLATSVTLPDDDPRHGQVLIDLLSGGGVDHDTYERFLTFAEDTCRLDEQQVKALGSSIGAPSEPEEACSPARSDEPTIADEDRLLTVDDVTSIEAFERNCPRIPNLSPDATAQPAHSFCGGDLPSLDLASGPGASYGIGFAKVQELLVRPGTEAAAAFRTALESSTTTGCPTSTVTTPNGSTTTATSVAAIDLPGVADPHAAYTAHLSTEASFGGQSGIPLELEAAFVLVQHDDELLLLIVTGRDPVAADDLDDLTVAAVQRAGW